MKTFTCSYPFSGGRHVVHVDAADETECSRRLRAIGMSAQVDGELIAEIPLEVRHGWLTKLRRLAGAMLS